MSEITERAFRNTPELALDLRGDEPSPVIAAGLKALRALVEDSRDAYLAISAYCECSADMDNAIHHAHIAHLAQQKIDEIERSIRPASSLMSMN